MNLDPSKHHLPLPSLWQHQHRQKRHQQVRQSPVPLQRLRRLSSPESQAQVHGGKEGYEERTSLHGLKRIFGITRQRVHYRVQPRPITYNVTTTERFETMIDALHYALWLWDKNQLKKLQEHLSLTYGNNETFWQVAQAIAEILPKGDKEKQLLQGLLYGRKSYRTSQQQELGF